MLLVYDGIQKNGKTDLKAYRLKKVAYFSTFFPLYSESVAYREFLKLLELELDVTSIAVDNGDPGPIPNDALKLVDKTTALKKLPFFARLGAHFRRWSRSPFKYWGAFFKQLFDAPLFARRKSEAIRLFHYGVLLARILENAEIEHLHVHHAGIPASIALTAYRLTGIPYSVTTYSRDLHTKNPDLKATLRQAEWITTMSLYDKEYLLDIDPFLEKEKITVLPAGVDLTLFTPEKDEKNLLQKPRVLAITHLTDNSGVDLLIKASKILASLDVEFETVIVGDGPERARFQSMANKLRLNQHVRLAGARRLEEILDLMRKADLFVLPCGRVDEESSDGFSITVLEAMACGLPVIACQMPWIDELVDESTGRIVPPGNHVVLAKAIQDLLTNEVLREKLARAARQRVANKFNLNEIMKRKISLLFPGIPMKSDARPIAWYMLEE